MSNRCTATHVVRCNGEPGHKSDHYPDKYYGSWKDGDPQPRIEITDEMIERACNAHFDAKNQGIMPGIGDPRKWEAAARSFGRVWADERRAWMRAALDAALNGDKH